jgi:signal transduction histidine kinase
MKLQTKVTASVGILIGLASVSVSSVSVLMSLDQNIRQSEQSLDQLAQLILESDDPVSTALFEGSTRELTALYTDGFGIETYLQENAGLIGVGNQVTQELVLADSESITLAVSTDAAYAGAQATIAPLALITLLVILLATLVTHLILKRDISSLNQIIRQARTIALGGERKLKEPQGSWEVHTLTDSLSKMIQSLDGNEKALQKFLSDASHELKTPLTVVRGYLDILSQPNVSEDVRLSAEKALKQSIRMQKIIDDLLQLAEIRGSEARLDTPIDLAGLVKEALEDLASLDSGHALEVEIPESVLIQGNPEQIERLISNLIGNIQAHVPSGSKVSVRLSQEAATVQLSFEDGGPGFPKGILGDDAKPVRFRKGDSQKSGSTGLGLSMIYEVVENHRGSVEIGKSALGGARISITLPKA